MLLPGIVAILHDSLLNHMTIITKVGASYVDHMNDVVLEVDSFSRGCCQALSSSPFLRKEPGDEANSIGANQKLGSSKKTLSGEWSRPFCSRFALRQV